MTASYTFDVFSSLDGFGSASGGNIQELTYLPTLHV
jgi:hypothetical protein